MVLYQVNQINMKNTDYPTLIRIFYKNKKLIRRFLLYKKDEFKTFVGIFFFNFVKKTDSILT